MIGWLNQRIVRRIFLGFGFTALVTLAVALVSISFLRGVAQELVLIADQDRLLQTNALKLRIALAEESDGVRGYLLSDDEVLLEPFTRGRSAFAAITVTLRELIQSDEDAQILFEAESLHEAFLEIAIEQLVLHEQGFPKAAIFLWQIEGTEVRTSLDGKLDELIDHQNQLIAAHKTNAVAEQNRAFVITLTLAGLVWVGVIAGGIWISRGITNPLASLSRTATQIAAGDLTIVANVERDDEIGELALAFNSMTDQLRNLVDSLELRVADRTRELKTLEELGRAIINGPPDASTLPELLSEYVPTIFPDFRIEIRESDQTLLRYPDDRQPVSAPVWEWLTAMLEPLIILPGESPPWDGQPASITTLITPILDEETKESIGGIHVNLDLDPDAVPTLFPAFQSLAAVVSSAIHGARVYSQQLIHESVTQELVLAGQIQSNFLPDNLPEIPGWQLAAMLEPAKEASGDFYDVIPLPNGRLGVLIADVADKGMGAALYMALSRTLIRTYAIEYDTQPEFVLGAANHRILEDIGTGQFVTVFYGILDPTSGELIYSNAGHNPPYIFSAQNGSAIQELDRTGVPLGILDDQTWQQGTAHLASNDVLLLYTDGITEAQNASGDFFDEDRLEEVVRMNLNSSATEIQNSVIAELGDFVNEAPQSDDITMMVVIHRSAESGDSRQR